MSDEAMKALFEMYLAGVVLRRGEIHSPLIKEIRLAFHAGFKAGQDSPQRRGEVNTAPHMKAWPWFGRFLCARILGHKDRNYAGPTMHYAYCLRCGYLFGNPWGTPPSDTQADIKEVPFG